MTAHASVLDDLADIVGTAQDQLWTWLMAPLVVLIGLYLTIRSGFVQFRWIPEMFRTVTDRSPLDDEGRPQSISAFQAFTLSAASRVGVGNIAGVGTAIAVGGPGAIFWMWLMAFIGGATSLVESSLAQLFKVREPSGRSAVARRVTSSVGWVHAKRPCCSRSC